jgi:alanine-glyoxylate transaminase/serine-glyoxylate transaminase/serine-pyruvate transaminase
VSVLIKARKQRVQSWFLDMGLVMAYWGGGQQRAYHHTAPINMLYALHEALLILNEEGLDNAWARHRRNHEALAAGLGALGLRFVVDAKYRLPQLNCVTLPAGIDDAAVRKQLLEDFSLEIGAGLGPLAGKVWRLGLMGYASNQRNVLFCLAALEAALKTQGARIDAGQAVHAAQTVYSG